MSTPSFGTDPTYKSKWVIVCSGSKETALAILFYNHLSLYDATHAHTSFYICFNPLNKSVENRNKLFFIIFPEIQIVIYI